MQWFIIQNIDQLDTPALVVYPERVRHNIQLAVEMAGGAERLRPHVKTHKSPQVTRLLLEAGITRFKCATIAEAEMLAMEGAAWAESPDVARQRVADSTQSGAGDTQPGAASMQAGAPTSTGKKSDGHIDVLLAYQPTGPKVERLVRLIKKYPATRFSCLIDHEESAQAMAVVFAKAGLRVPVYIDLDLGMGRTGVIPAAAYPLYIGVQHLEGIEVVGLHGYDGHIRDVDMVERRKKCDAAFGWVEALRQAIQSGRPGGGGNASVRQLGGADASTGTGRSAQQSGGANLAVIVGGSPTFPIHCEREGVECSPGTFVYWDKGYSDGCPEQGFLPAALVVTRVVSLPDTNRVTLDLGHKSIAAENELAKRVFFLNAQRLKPIGQSEEHLVMEYKGEREEVDVAVPNWWTQEQYAEESTLATEGTGVNGHADQGVSGDPRRSQPYQIGDVLYGIPYHICPTVALYERAFTVEEGKNTGEWKNIARDRIISI